MDLLRPHAVLAVVQLLELSCVAWRDFKGSLHTSFPLKLCSAQLPAAVLARGSLWQEGLWSWES